jgi:peptidoglycan-N-acetylglucosamine deacetylase
MARRRSAALALAALALALGGCAAAHAQANPAWHPAANSASQAASPAGSPAASPSVSPSPSRSPKSSPSPSGSPDAPTPPPPTPGTGAGGGTGPAGSFRTTGSSAVALTFDDGPSGYTPQLLDMLAQYHIKATFCLIGREIAGYPDVVKRIVAEGHTLCNHTWSHDEQLRTRTADRIQSELQRTSDAIHALVPDAPIKYFRNPGGNFSPQTVSIAASMGMKSIFWNVDPMDWRKPGVQPIINNVLNHTAQGSIVLMHDGGGDRSQTMTACKTILPNLAGRFTLIALPTS